MTEDIERIIEVANELLSDGVTAGSTSEQIAAAFILNDMRYLPSDYYNVYSAWERLGEQWQGYVKQAQQQYKCLHHAGKTTSVCTKVNTRSSNAL